MNKVEVRSENEDDEKKVLDRAERFCKKILRELKIDGWEVSVLFCGDAYMRELNKNYRNIDKPTDVLSFCMEDEFPEHEMVYAGDIVVSLETCRRQAEDNRVSFDEELKRLMVHGLLHLKGYVHDAQEEYDRMMDLQERLLGMTAGERII